MKLGHLAIAAGILVAKYFLSKQTITWTEIETWITQNGNHDLIGIGFVGGSFRTGNSSSYAEIRRDQNDGKIMITASILFNARQGVFASQSWTGSDLEKALLKRFGDNRRFRIRL